MGYICEKCSKEFESQRTWALHLASHKLSENAKNYVDEYVEIHKVCLKCRKEFSITAKKSRRDKNKLIYNDINFCSSACSHSRKQTEEANLKRSNALKGYIHKKKEDNNNCIECGIKISKKEDNNNCIECGIKISKKAKRCRKCSSKHTNSNPESRRKNSEAAKKRVREGTHKGWQSRNIESYPETFFKKVLNENNLSDYKFNHPVSKNSLGVNENSNYFLDFFFEDLKLDLEIDGKQHTYDERAKSDKVRDELLKRNGYIVYRIKWKSINNEDGKKYMKDEIDKFMSFIKSIPIA